MSLFQFVDEIDGSVLFEVKKDIIYRFKREVIKFTETAKLRTQVY